MVLLPDSMIGFDTILLQWSLNEHHQILGLKANPTNKMYAKQKAPEAQKMARSFRSSRYLTIAT